MKSRAKVIIGDSRNMDEVSDESIDLIVTSPPYWHLKDYGNKGQIGYGQTLHQYLKDLYQVWKECYRILKPGRRLCINIGDQFARSIVYGRYKVIPLHAEVIIQCERLGFDYMGSIIWQKKTTMNTTGGATVMGSYPYPPNGIVEIDYEYILIFKKPGRSAKMPKELKEQSKLSKEEWKEYFNGHWNFGGAKQVEHEAMFPEELPRRLIRMFSFVGETVLDPFLGSGTTIKVALDLERNGIGYEINRGFLPIIKKKLQNNLFGQVEIVEKEPLSEMPVTDYTPAIQDAEPKIEPEKFRFKGERLYRVIEVINADTLLLDTGLKVKFLGIKIVDEKKALKYLREKVLKKQVFLKFEDSFSKEVEDTVEAYVFLKNRIFVNSYLVKSGIAVTDTERHFRYRSRFLTLEKEKLHA